jgi:ribose transport system substrate-binding protein
MKRGQSGTVHLLIVLVALALASCEKPLHEETERYYFVAANISLPYWQEAQAGFMDSARQLGVKAEAVGPTSYAPNEELDAFQKALEKRPSGILVSPARPEIFKDAIDGAVKAGIPVVCADSDAPESKRILFIGTDNFRAGSEGARRLAQLLHNQGNVIVISIPGQFNLDQRFQGAKSVLADYSKIKITQTLDDKGDPRMANDEISAMLEKKEKIDGILCLEASGGPGAAEALHRLGMEGKIPLVGMDKDPETLDGISRGSIAATIAQKPYTMAFYGLKFLDDLHHNIVHEFRDWRTAPASPLPSFVDTGTAVVDSSNLAAFQAAEAARPKPPGQQQ